MNRNVTSYVDFGVKLRRILAWLFDWMLSVLAGVTAGLIVSVTHLSNSSFAVSFVLTMLPVTFILMAFRDLIFKGRSLGKRLLRLHTVDRYTGAKASRRQCAARGFLLPLYFFDGILLLTTGCSIGDNIAKTAVIDEFTADKFSEFDEVSRGVHSSRSANYAYTPEPTSQRKGYVLNGEYVADGISDTQAPNKVSKTRYLIPIVSAILIIFIFIAVILSIVFTALDNIKDTEQYAVAYEYLVNSRFFELIGTTEDSITLTGYRHSYTSDGEDAEFTFKITDISVKVYCHRENGKWIACDDCSGLGIIASGTDEMMYSREALPHLI